MKFLQSLDLVLAELNMEILLQLTVDELVSLLEPRLERLLQELLG
jgi:hypothetical protein